MILRSVRDLLTERFMIANDSRFEVDGSSSSTERMRLESNLRPWLETRQHLLPVGRKVQIDVQPLQKLEEAAKLAV